MSTATVASLAVEDVPAVAISSLIEGVPICVDDGGSKLIADLESSTSCSQRKVASEYNLLHLYICTISSYSSVQGSLPVSFIAAPAPLFWLGKEIQQ